MLRIGESNDVQDVDAVLRNEVGILSVLAPTGEDMIVVCPPGGAWSGGLVFLSIVPYAIRTYEGKIQPVPTTWSLWSLIGLAVLLTYRSSGAEANVWPAVFGFVNPVLITILSVWKGTQWKKPSSAERFCSLAGVVSLGRWMF